MDVIMSGSDHREHQRLIDKFADSAMPKVDNSAVSQRPAWWWFFLMPGKVILWLDYMFPRRVGGVFGTARRRNIPLLQLLYSLYFYFLIVALSFGLYLLIRFSDAPR
jgi:hypothetical protein